MARTKQTTRKPIPRRGGRFGGGNNGNGNGNGNGRSARSYGPHDLDFIALQEEAERRERILADQRRVAAKWRPKIPEVRKVNFENFKNRFQGENEPDYAIDVLMAGPGLQGQIRRERAIRRSEETARVRKSFYSLYDAGTDRRKKIDPLDKVKREKRNELLSTDTEIQRVRVQSQPVLGHLTSLLNDTESRSTPRTFMRPFKALVYFQPKMKDILATLEEKWADYEELDEHSDAADTAASEDAEVIVEIDSKNDTDAETKSDAEGDEDDKDDVESLASVDSNVDEDFDSLMDSPEALRDMRCYVKFIDEEIMPLYQRFEGSTAEKVKFDDLWSLFRVGDLVYMPAAVEAGGRYHEVWRIYKIQAPQPETSYPKNGWGFFDEFDDIDDQNKFKISAYYVDYDGTAFGAVKTKFEIEGFAGERSIDSLPCYPMRYQPGHEELISGLKGQGRQFLHYLEDRHQQHNAWTLTRNPPSHRNEPDQEILDNEYYEKMRHPEFVESDVIVDMTEAYQKMPNWRPDFHQLAVNKAVRCEIADDEIPIQKWFDGVRQNRSYVQKEIIQKADGIESRQRRDNLAVDTFLRNRLRGSRNFEANAAAQKLRDEDLVLLPKRMFAYALRERRFMPIDLNLLKPIRREVGVFENLRIHGDYKDVVRSLVMSHFRKKQLERRYVDAATEGPGQDLIQGKGRGLVVLLHGVPGVGKTATAEAVAMENKKPLFVITCGDLGLSPHEVESSLKNVFRLAHLWDCVLLLDEADVFLSQRSKLDMKRNALVSVFLRVLEYYNGLLFLTTNRVGTIDEAFKSRIHLSLYYPPLDKTQTTEIFRLNVAKLRVMESERHKMTGEPSMVIKDDEILEFAAKHYEDLARSTGCWNGRQIRNAFQIASSLALHNYTKNADMARAKGQLPPAAPVLDRTLFDKVQMSTQSFDKHMKKEEGKYDDEIPMRGTFDD